MSESKAAAETAASIIEAAVEAQTEAVVERAQTAVEEAQIGAAEAAEAANDARYAAARLEEELRAQSAAQIADAIGQHANDMAVLREDNSWLKEQVATLLAEREARQSTQPPLQPQPEPVVVVVPEPELEPTVAENPQEIAEVVPAKTEPLPSHAEEVKAEKAARKRTFRLI